jgi:hypothetical protein
MTSIFMALAIFFSSSGPASAAVAVNSRFERPALSHGNNANVSHGTAALLPSATAAADEAMRLVGPATKELPAFVTTPLMANSAGDLPAESGYDRAEISPVPEPSSLVLGAWGLAIMGYVLRRRQLRRESRR